MSGFDVSFNSAANALGAIQRALDGVQNNIVNASTPGYATERINFSARPFNPSQGVMSGVDLTLSSAHHSMAGAKRAGRKIDSFSGISRRADVHDIVLHTIQSTLDRAVGVGSRDE